VGGNNFPSNSPQQLLGFPIDLNTGALGTPISVPTANTPVGIVADPAGKFLYYADEITGFIHGFTLNPTSGALSELPGSPFPGRPDGSNIFFGGLLISDISGNFVYEIAAGQIWGLSKSSTGTLAAFGNFAGGVFGATFDPSNQLLYVGGCSGEFQLPACVYGKNSAGALAQIPQAALPALTNVTSQDATVHPTGNFVYESGIFDPSPLGTPPAPVHVVLSFSVDHKTGLLSALPNVMTKLNAGNNFTDIAMHPTGKFLYVNTEDDIWGFSIDAHGGLTAIPGSPFPGKLTPLTGRAFRIDATGNFLYEGMLNPNDNTSLTGSGIMAFRIDQNTGALSPLPGAPFKIGTVPGVIAIARIP
jgi:DNA-binding beta-propeller fold protein YncE